jgi:hypothetical protein
VSCTSRASWVSTNEPTETSRLLRALDLPVTDALYAEHPNFRCQAAPPVAAPTHAKVFTARRYYRDWFGPFEADLHSTYASPSVNTNGPPFVSLTYATTE